MEDQKQLILAFFLIMLILLLWQFFFPPKAPPVSREARPRSEEKPSTETVLSQVPKRVRPKIEETQEFVLENEKLRVKFSNLGATIKSVYLKEYACELLKDFPYFPIQISKKETIWHLDTLFWDFSLSGEEITFRTQIGTQVHRGDQGLRIQRRYQLKSYTIVSEIEYSSLDTHPPLFSINFGRGLSFTEKDTNDEYANFRILADKETGFWEMGVRRLKKPITLTERLTWLGFTTKYFLMAVIGEIDSVTILPTPDRKAGALLFITQPAFLSLGFYPLKYDLLAHEKKGLEKAVPLGWPKFLSLGILHLLLFLHSLIKNYGVVILIFSLLMKGVLFPLTRLQLQQMKKLQLLQPKLEELRKKYKNDPKMLNQETMRLYSLYKMNPLTGCLPLLAQIPIFWALYSVLRSTVELRRASFIFWLKDLSVKDPYYILPILMGVSFLFQNLLTTQDKRNLFLTFFFPVFLTVIFLNFPSGLQLYWLIFNILSVVESLIVRKRR